MYTHFFTYVCTIYIPYCTIDTFFPFYTFYGSVLRCELTNSNADDTTTSLAYSTNYLNLFTPRIIPYVTVCST